MGPAEMSSPNVQSLRPGTPGGPGAIFAGKLIAVITGIYQRVRFSFQQITLILKH